MEFQEFDAHDWAAFAGAEEFDDGSQPVKRPVTYEGAPSELIADANGIYLVTDLEDGIAYIPMSGDSKDEILARLAAIPAELTAKSASDIGLCPARRRPPRPMSGPSSRSTAPRSRAATPTAARSRSSAATAGPRPDLQAILNRFTLRITAE